MSTYKVVSTIWHTKESKYYEPGETVDLSHLDGIGIAALLDSGAIVVVSDAPERKRKVEPPTEEGG